jgi:hypothetical protein
MANEEKNPFSYGMKFGDWTVIERAANIGKETAYACECKCGKISNINKISLTKGRSRSCIKCAKAKTRIVRYSVDDFVGDWKLHPTIACANAEKLELCKQTRSKEEIR